MITEMDGQDMKNTLPRLPAKGQRRKLEAQWLGLLEAGNMRAETIRPHGDAPQQLHEGMRMFNDGLYWECHEVLEEIWLETPYPQRFFWSALIKLAVGLHHAERHNLHGARVKIGDAVRLLPLFQPRCLGVDTATALQDALRWQQALNVLPLDWAAVDQLPRPSIDLETQR